VFHTSPRHTGRLTLFPASQSEFPNKAQTNLQLAWFMHVYMRYPYGTVCTKTKCTEQGENR